MFDEVFRKKSILNSAQKRLLQDLKSLDFFELLQSLSSIKDLFQDNQSNGPAHVFDNSEFNRCFTYVSVVLFYLFGKTSYFKRGHRDLLLSDFDVDDPLLVFDKNPKFEINLDYSTTSNLLNSIHQFKTELVCYSKNYSNHSVVNLMEKHDISITHLFQIMNRISKGRTRTLVVSDLFHPKEEPQEIAFIQEMENGSCRFEKIADVLNGFSDVSFHNFDPFQSEIRIGNSLQRITPQWEEEEYADLIEANLKDQGLDDSYERSWSWGWTHLELDGEIKVEISASFRIVQISAKICPFQVFRISICESFTQSRIDQISKALVRSIKAIKNLKVDSKSLPTYLVMNSLDKDLLSFILRSKGMNIWSENFVQDTIEYSCPVDRISIETQILQLKSGEGFEIHLRDCEMLGEVVHDRLPVSSIGMWIPSEYTIEDLETLCDIMVHNLKFLKLNTHGHYFN
ncbi:hypothetical protein MJH12_01960 [bacterium]|nr:hypothetical protein [bacterium]